MPLTPGAWADAHASGGIVEMLIFRNPFLWQVFLPLIVIVGVATLSFALLTQGIVKAIKHRHLKTERNRIAAPQGKLLNIAI
jgi:hypothetical protein